MLASQRTPAIDLKSFYASVECFLNPALRGHPVAVAGNPELRHGIVLAKNYEAKRFGIQTGEALWQAREKCPDIIFVPPHYDKYIEAGAALKNLGDKEKIQVSINQLSEKIAFEEKKINECIAKENSISLDIDIDDLNNEVKIIEDECKIKMMGYLYQTTPSFIDFKYYFTGVTNSIPLATSIKVETLTQSE